MKKMTAKQGLPLDELASRLESCEARWTKQGLPLKWRCLESFKSIYGSVSDNDGRALLFNEITSWYIDKYGHDAMQWDGIIGRIPVLLRNKVYLVQVPFVTEPTAINFVDRFENLPKNVAKSITREEFDILVRKVANATISWYALYTLSADDTFFGETETSLLKRACFDLEAAASILATSGDVQGSIFHSHASGEKFLKVAFKHSGGAADLKTFSHNAPKVFRELIKLNRRYSWLDLSVERLQNLAPNMNIRYATVDRTIEDAISAFHSSLYLCGVFAEMWNFDHVRGSKTSSFEAGRFYKNSSNRMHYCKHIKNNTAHLLLFNSDQWTGRQLMDITADKSLSPLYLEITDIREDAHLRGILLSHLRSPGRQVTAADIGLKSASGPEGHYSTAVFRIPR